MAEFIRLDKINTKFNNIIARPLCYTTKDGYDRVVIVDNSQIYSLYLHSNKMRKEYTFTDPFRASLYGNWFNQSANTLFIIGTDKCLLSIQLNKHIHHSDISYISRNGLANINFDSTLYIPTPYHQIHFINENSHNILHLDSNSLRQNECPMDSGTYPKVVYNEANNKIFICGADNDDTIWYYDLTNTKWMVYNMCMPYQTWNEEYHIISLGSFLILFYVYDAEMFILDIANDAIYKTQLIFPNKINKFSLNVHFFVDKNKFVHLIDWKYGTHLKQDVYKMLPKKLNDKYKYKRELLVLGYVNEFENHYGLFQPIALYLKQIIVSFYPFM